MKYVVYDHSGRIIRVVTGDREKCRHLLEEDPPALEVPLWTEVNDNMMVKDAQLVERPSMDLPWGNSSHYDVPPGGVTINLPEECTVFIDGQRYDNMKTVKFVPETYGDYLFFIDKFPYKRVEVVLRVR